MTNYLTNTDASRMQVADKLGYGDQAAFNIAFKLWYGKAPGQWRREHASENPVVQ